MKFKPSKKIPNRGKLILETKEEIMFIKEVLGNMTTRKDSAVGLSQPKGLDTYNAMCNYLKDERPLYRVEVELKSTAELISVEL